MADEEDAVAIVCALFLTGKKNIRKTRKGDGQRGGDNASIDYTCYIMIWS